MPRYAYTGISATGERVSGVEVAESERQLVRFVEQKGYVVTTVRLEQKVNKPFLARLNDAAESLRPISLPEKLMFTRNLQVMVSSGISLPRALNVLKEQAQNKGFKKAIDAIHARVVQGKSLSEGLQEHPRIFSDLFVNMVKVGEESGTMETVLGQLTIQMDREHELKSRVKGALMYPAVVVTAMIGVGILMLVVVVPQLAAVFDDLGVDLPLTTQVIVEVGSFTSTYWFIVFPGFIVALFGLLRLIRMPRGKRIFDTVILKTPVFGGIVRKANTALMTRTLSSLLAAGVPIVRALEITSHVVGNWHFQESLRVSGKEARKGKKISETLEAYKDLYPAIVIQMIAVGEETGETGTILAKLADFFEQEVLLVTKNLTSIIEPILMLIIGGVVGFFAISMLQPMYSVLRNIQ